MTEEQDKPWQARWFDTALVATLVAAVCTRATVTEGGFGLSLLHGLFLLLGYVLLSALLRRMSQTLATGLLVLTAVLLLSELSVQLLTGLHVNWFLVSLLLQPDAETQIGFSGLRVIALVALLALTIGIASWKARSHATPLSPLLWTALTVGIFVSAQWVYTVAYFDGAARILETRRTLPFFWAPHPYRSNKLLGYIFGPRGENPFSVSKETDRTPTSEPTSVNPNLADLSSAPNILIIIADSWRAKDLVETQAIAPSFLATRDTGYLSLNHSSVSNCTHFSMYSLFTGKLATGYGHQRRQMRPTGLLQTLYSAGYKVTSAESIAMNWYNLADILLPVGTLRQISDREDVYESDQQVTANTLEVIEQWQTSSAPQAHVAFFQGTHFPYHGDRFGLGLTSLERYKLAITALDKELGTLLEAVENTATNRRTLVLVTSDHGEEFFDEGIVGHASRLTAEQVTVPLLVLGKTPNTKMPRSHTEIHDFILAEIGLLDAGSDTRKPNILANSDYDHPNGFALLTEQGKFEFTYDDGYLVPTVDTNTAFSKSDVSKAAKVLLRSITN